MPMMDAPMGYPTGDPMAGKQDFLRAAIEYAQLAQAEEPDDGDSQLIAAAIKTLYQILAARQKESDSLMGNPTLLRTLRRSGA